MEAPLFLVDLLTIRNLLLLFLVYIVPKATYQIVYYRLFHPLKDFSGPFWWSVTRLPLAWSNFTNSEISSCQQLIKEYGSFSPRPYTHPPTNPGPIVRISPNLLLVSTASTLPLIYHRTARKTPHYTLFSWGKEGTAFHMWEHADHAARAKTVAGIYSTRAHMKSTEECMDRNVAAWLQKIEGIGEVDLGEWVQFLTMDVIIELAFGNENALGFVEKGKDVGGLCKGFKDALPFYGLVCRLHPFWTWLNTTWAGRFFDWFMLHGDYQMGRTNGFVHRMCKKKLKELEMGVEKKDDMLQALVDARTPDGKPLTYTTLRGEATVIVIAGADNSTAAICTTILHLLKSPAALQRVRSELEAARPLLFSSPTQAEILKHCPFYVTCVKESMRLNPSLPSHLPRYSEPGLVINDVSIPPNTEIASNPWITQRDPEIYGEDAEEWIPERWQDENKAKVLERFSFTFGFGSRLCLGRQLGMMSALKVPLMFLDHFEVELMREARLTVRADFSYWENFRVMLVEGVQKFVT